MQQEGELLLRSPEWPEPQSFPLLWLRWWTLAALALRNVAEDVLDMGTAPTPGGTATSGTRNCTTHTH